jgi:hypothetical protein
VASIEVKGLGKPDESRAFANGQADMVVVGTTMVGRARLEPGWRWSNDVKPITGTDSCMVLHKGYCIAGQIHVSHNDGTEGDIGPGDAYEIQPGHDAWVVGDEIYEAIDFSEQMAEYAKPSS